MVDWDALTRLRQEIAAAGCRADAMAALGAANEMLDELPEPTRERVLEEITDMLAEKPA